MVPHIDEIAHRGVYNGVGPKHTDTFLERYSRENKVVKAELTDEVDFLKESLCVIDIGVNRIQSGDASGTGG